MGGIKGKGIVGDRREDVEDYKEEEGCELGGWENNKTISEDK